MIMNSSLISKVSLLLVGVLACGSGLAMNEDVTARRGFVAAHPDMYWRTLAQDDVSAGRLPQAFERFRRSAHYADKASQAMVAEMLWKGEGVAQNRPLAYAWMDLAAERGYKDLLVVREQYWAGLTVDERARAIEVGAEVYAEFGDDVAKPRMARELQRARSNITGSRLGRVGTLVIPGSLNEHGTNSADSTVDGSSFGHVTDGSIYFADKYWVPKLYWEWQDTQWSEGGSGRVTVLPIQQAPPVEP